MPGKKSKRVGGGRKPKVPSDSEEMDSLETASVLSVLSSGSSYMEDVIGTADEGIDESSSAELFADKFMEAIDGLLEKRQKARVYYLKMIAASLQNKMCGDVLYGRHETIGDSLKRIIRQGKHEERLLAASCLSLLFIQLENDPDNTDARSIFLDVQPLLTALLTDNSVPAKTRASMAECLSIGIFLTNTEPTVLIENMNVLHSVFSKSYLKGNDKIPNIDASTAELHTAALQGWALLLTDASTSQLLDNVDNILLSVPELLHSPHVDLRRAAGETIALVYERMRLRDEDYEGPLFSELVEHLHALATECSKSVAKKDKKVQRSTFRDVLRSVEADEAVRDCIKFGRESLEICSWADLRRYSAFKSILGPGTSKHLKENFILRSIFMLGEPIVDSAPKDGISRKQRHLVNMANERERTQWRAKFRDKRNPTMY